MTTPLVRLVNWLIFAAWPHMRRWLWLLYRVALVVAFLLALLAVLVTVCRQAQSDRSEGTRPPPWTTRVWAAEYGGGVTIRATTGHAKPDHRPATPTGTVLFAGLLLLVVLVLGAAGLAAIVVSHGTFGASGAVMGLVKVRTVARSAFEGSGWLGSHSR